MILRDAVATDFPAVTAIYNSVVLTSTAIYNDTPVTLEDRLSYWRSRVEQGYPFLVAEEDNAILGYATFGDFRPWPGYRFTVEGSIHIREDAPGRGIGTALLTQLTGLARACGKHVMVAGVDSANLASIAFLTRFGFTSAGILHEVGFKFSRYLDLHFLEYRL